MVIISLIYVRTRYWAVELSFQVQALRKKHDVLIEEKNQLLLEASTLKHPKRLMEWAARLGLTFEPENTDVGYLDE